MRAGTVRAGCEVSLLGPGRAGRGRGAKAKSGLAWALG
jgi:hypothetical protein